MENEQLKPIPQSLNECRQMDPTSTSLWAWADKLKLWGERLFLVLLVVGIISTISTAIEVGNVNEDLVFGAVVSSLLTWILYAFIEYCVYHVLALLISALASITQNTTVTANVALYEAAKTFASSEPQSDPQPKPVAPPVFHDTTAFWNEETEYPSQPVEKAPVLEDTWTCYHCGTQNKSQYGQCKKCGQYRSR